MLNQYNFKFSFSGKLATKAFLSIEEEDGGGVIISILLDLNPLVMEAINLALNLPLKQPCNQQINFLHADFQTSNLHIW